MTFTNRNTLIKFWLLSTFLKFLELKSRRQLLHHFSKPWWRGASVGRVGDFRGLNTCGILNTSPPSVSPFDVILKVCRQCFKDRRFWFWGGNMPTLTGAQDAECRRDGPSAVGLLNFIRFVSSTRFDSTRVLYRCAQLQSITVWVYRWTVAELTRMEKKEIHCRMETEINKGKENYVTWLGDVRFVINDRASGWAKT